MNIETLFELDKKQAKIDDFVANLKKNPKQISEYKNLVLNGGLDPREQAIEKKRKADYSQWVKDNAPSKIFSKPISKTLDHRK